MTASHFRDPSVVPELVAAIRARHGMPYEAVLPVTMLLFEQGLTVEQVVERYGASELPGLLDPLTA